MNKPIIFSLILIFLLLNLSSCKKIVKYKTKISTKNKVVEKKEEVPDYIIYDVKHYHYSKGKLTVRIDFEKGVYFSNESVLNIENCRFVYYDEDGEVLSKGQADRAKLYMKKSFMKAWNNIEIESVKNGTKLDTSYLEWDGNDNIFLTDKPVRIVRKNGDNISGVGMEADIALNVVTIKKNVKGLIKSR